jgi:Co/Zn/Cd efflux system component
MFDKIKKSFSGILISVWLIVGTIFVMIGFDACYHFIDKHGVYAYSMTIILFVGFVVNFLLIILMVKNRNNKLVHTTRCVIVELVYIIDMVLFYHRPFEINNNIYGYIWNSIVMLIVIGMIANTIYYENKIKKLG